MNRSYMLRTGQMKLPVRLLQKHACGETSEYVSEDFYEVGERFFFKSIRYEVVEEETCAGCGLPCGLVGDSPFCSEYSRKDNRSVIFKLV